jgi:hypothetical protein
MRVGLRKGSGSAANRAALQTVCVVAMGLAHAFACSSGQGGGSGDGRADAAVPDASLDAGVPDGNDAALDAAPLDGPEAASPDDARSDDAGVDALGDAVATGVARVDDAALDAFGDAVATGDAGVDDAALDAFGEASIGVDAESDVTCTFSINDVFDPADAGACGSCALPDAGQTVVSNVPLYVVPYSNCVGATYGLVVDEQALFGQLFTYDTFCLVPGPDGGTVGSFAFNPEVAWMGGMSLSGGVATLDFSGTITPAIVGCGVSRGCYKKTVACRGTGTAPLSPCATNNGGCSAFATCTWSGPTSNRVSCACNAGYTGDGYFCG